ncbi:helix-turn-helix domain-containing protein [Bacillus sp. FJAT-28004]|uniref:helix-turn-helix domain-containing protein n=1 Tax=Bacillus sp. FJAT-28004 TaxID=1679165 RepID=UPI0006B4C825|nr:helix-turn-helix domain-containing protein [Bacillus sp. FJAT-28004]
MKKVIIVDDNRMVVKSVYQLIPWEQHGYVVTAKVFDGVQALEAIKINGADLLVTDIKMPFMDGLELIRQVRQLGCDAKAVILSSYNDFELVREAMRLGASEYILKTELDPSSFITLLNTLARQLDTERKELDQLVKLEGFSEADLNRLKDADNELFRNRRHIREQLLRGFCIGYVTEEQFLAQRKDYLNIRYDRGRHAMLYVAADNFHKLLELRWNGNEQLLAFAATNVMEEILDNAGEADLFYNGSGTFVILINIVNLESDLEKSRWIHLFSSLSSSLEHYFRLRISGGFGMEKPGVDTVPKLYVQAMEACQFRFIQGKGKLFFDEDIQKTGVGQNVAAPYNSYERVELLRNALSAFHPQLLLKTPESLFVHPDHVTPENFRDMLRLYEKYTFVLTDFVEKYGMRNVCDDLIQSFNEYIYDQEAIPDLNRRLQEILERIAEGMETGNSQVRQLIKYVQGHFKDEVTLQSAAEHLGISSAYLGRLVQKELGVNYSEYLNQYRIERAKVLLTEGLYKIYEIAEAVGYGSTEHFSRMFKKVTGISPKEFSSGKPR